jgi:hypothetical protein
MSPLLIRSSCCPSNRPGTETAVTLQANDKTFSACSNGTEREPTVAASTGNPPNAIPRPVPNTNGGLFKVDRIVERLIVQLFVVVVRFYI